MIFALAEIFLLLGCDGQLVGQIILSSQLTAEEALLGSVDSI